MIRKKRKSVVLIAKKLDALDIALHNLKVMQAGFPQGIEPVHNKRYYKSL